MEKMEVPMIDLKAQYKEIKKEVLEAIVSVLERQDFILGKEVFELEEAISKYVGAKFSVGVASGTDGILLSLMALGIGPGDAVIVPAYTFFSTASSVVRLFARPIFIDVEKDSYNIDPKKLKKFLETLQFSGKYPIFKADLNYFVKAIICVHLFGQPADMDPIMEVAKRFNLSIIEDSCQSIGAKYKENMVGTLGDAGVFSFFPTKNLGGFGDGGMVVTNNEEIYKKVKMLRVHGEEKKNHFRRVGINSRLDTIQAAVLLRKLAYLDKWIEKRIEVAKIYDELFQEKGPLRDGLISTPKVMPYVQRHTFNQYVIKVVPDGKRNRLKSYLSQKGIKTAIYYPLSLHMQEAFHRLGYRKGDFPSSEYLQEHTLALPIYPEIPYEHQKYVVSSIESFFSRNL